MSEGHILPQMATSDHKAPTTQPQRRPTSYFLILQPHIPLLLLVTVTNHHFVKQSLASAHNGRQWAHTQRTVTVKGDSHTADITSDSSGITQSHPGTPGECTSLPDIPGLSPHSSPMMGQLPGWPRKFPASSICRRWGSLSSY